MANMVNIHIYPSSMKNESRILKEVQSIKKLNIFDEIILLGVYDKNLPKSWSIDETINVKLIKTYGDGKIMKYIFLYMALLKLMMVKKIKQLNIHNVELLPFAFIAKKIFKSTVIYDTHELETERNSLHGKRQKLYRKIEKKFIGYCDRVIVVGDAIAEFYKKIYPTLDRPTVILNTPYYKTNKKRDIFREKFNIAQDKIVFLYQGSLSRGRNVEMMLTLFKHREDSDAVIVFMGYGDFEALVKSYANSCDNIYFHEAVTPDILQDYTSSADFGISMIEDSCLSYHYCLPNKMFEYLMADVPVIVSNLPEMKKIVEQYSVGVVAKENTIKGLNDAIEDAMSLNRDEVRQNIKNIKKIYNWEEQEKILFELYRGLAL